jgi:hypothetical protein
VTFFCDHPLLSAKAAVPHRFLATTALYLFLAAPNPAQAVVMVVVVVVVFL